MYLIPRSPWLRALLVWTAFIAILIVLRLPGASAPPPCGAPSAGAPDPSLPSCGADYINLDALAICLLGLLWLAGLALEAVAWGVARLARWLLQWRSAD